MSRGARGERTLFSAIPASPPLADAESVDPSLAGTVLNIAAYNGGDEAMYEEFRKRFEAATVPVERNRYLGVLGAFRDPKLRDKAFAYALTDKIGPNEIFTIPFSQRDTEESRAYLFQLGARQLRHHRLARSAAVPAAVSPSNIPEVVILPQQIAGSVWGRYPVD